MKYVVSWRPRAGGGASENEAGQERSLAVFSKWSPPADETFHQFLVSLDGEHGYAVVETDNPLSILEGPAKFSPYFEFSVVPVVDITEGIPVLSEAVEFRRSIS
jgi:hypothetical protein